GPSALATPEDIDPDPASPLDAPSATAPVVVVGEESATRRRADPLVSTAGPPASGGPIEPTPMTSGRRGRRNARDTDGAPAAVVRADTPKPDTTPPAVPASQ